MPAAGSVRAGARAGGVPLEQGVLGLGVERGGRLVEHQQQRLVAHEAAGQGELLPLSEGDLDAVRPGRAELGVEPGREPRSTTSSAPARSTAATDRRLVVEAGHVADADGVLGRAARTGRSPGRRRPAGTATRRPACAPGRPRRPGSGRAVGLVELATAASPAWSCRRRSRRRSRPPSRPAGSGRRPRAPVGPCRGRRTMTCSKRMPVGAAVRHRRVGVLDERRPRSPPARPGGASRPARCRAGSRSRRPWRRCRPTAARRRRAPAARRRAARGARRRRTRSAPTYPAPKIAQASACHHGRAPAGRGDRPVPALPGGAALRPRAGRRCR